ncbi:hypothetical protein QFC24_006698 [Naganishia onofrii]|uniref:Uncharacterized protein n=1 Tax=Naganishia onofrii TaxID=1851511 RepID=A0ACC2X0F3_9TREE|nr:hypothetical protein QFC24_006698 [Naganishia onofrii]
MGIGIIYNQDNATADEEVPGTCVFGSSLQTVDDQLKATLKRDKKNSELILRPQPSDDPADPLNWSPFRKEAAYLSLLLGAILVGVIGPLLVPDFGNILAEYKISLTQVIALNGWLVLTYGISSFLCVSLSDAMGRRPMYLASNLVISAGIVWGVNAKTYRSLLGARIVQGFGMGAYGCLVSSTITDVFFLHEQGTRVAIWQLAFNGSICITPIISGVLIQKLGRPEAFWILFVLAVLALVTSVLFLAETVYDRNDGVVTPVQMTDLDSDSKYVHDSKDSAIVSVEPAFKIEYRSNTIIPSQPMFTKSNLKPWKPLRYNTKEMITAMYRPALTLLSPNIMYATLLFTTTFTWFVQLSSLYSTIFGAPPYSFDSAKIGYISGISPFIGTMLALVTAGPLADRSARFLSKRNQGMFEAEMRLVLAPSAWAMQSNTLCTIWSLPS